MKVLMLNGSPNKGGNTAHALGVMEEIFRAEGAEVEIVQVGSSTVRGCIGCRACRTKGKCVFDDIVNEIGEKLKTADALILGSPVYYASPNGTLLACLDRLFYSTSFDLTMKVGASVAVARRGGTTATLDALNKYFGITGMPIATSTYWNMYHGKAPEGVEDDEEGLQTLRNLARNVVFLARSIALGREKYGLPEKEPKVRTNFIR